MSIITCTLCIPAERSPQTEPSTRVPRSCLGFFVGESSIRHVRAHSLDAGVGVVG